MSSISCRKNKFITYRKIHYLICQFNHLIQEIRLEEDLNRSIHIDVGILVEIPMCESWNNEKIFSYNPRFFQQKTCMNFDLRKFNVILMASPFILERRAKAL